MTFRMNWLPEALAQLADAWATAADRNAVTEASRRLDQRLARDPFGEGESRAGADRIAFEAPLRVLYRIDAAARVVHVVSLGVYGRRA